MKRVLGLLFVFVWLSSFDTEEVLVQFYQGKYSDLLAKAKAENKPFIIDFYTVWCGPCKNMERYTFTNKNLANYIKDNYLAFKVDAESLMGDGIELAQKYEVKFYPTVIIFSPKGEVLKRLSGFQNADALEKELRKYKGAQPSTPSTPAIAGTPSKPTQTILQPNVGEGLFKLAVSKQENAGYGVQIGVYADYANIIKQASNLDESFHRNVLVAITKTADKPIFRLILGPFSSKEQADNYLKSLKNTAGKNGMVVDLGKIFTNNVTASTSPAPTPTDESASRSFNLRKAKK
ncbi:MAG: thioredoxin fold domain-containing protein [Bacteroidia bacterium]